eukprot:m.367672 g.367672  ORF g.367672 m.367672 type:complete len:358 (-) comp56086_c0_seq3:1971-3044(-)
MAARAQPPETFVFQTQKQRVDWRSVAAINIDNIVRTLDLDALDRIGQNIMLCDLDAEGIDNLDVNVSKLFRLAQLLQQFLLFLHNQSLKEVAQLKQANAELSKGSEASRDAISQLKQEAHKKSQQLRAMQRMIESQSSAHNCQFCQKRFMSVQFLHSHLERRHAENGPFDFERLRNAQAQPSPTVVAIANLREELKATQQQQQQLMVAKAEQELRFRQEREQDRHAEFEKHRQEMESLRLEMLSRQQNALEQQRSSLEGQYRQQVDALREELSKVKFERDQAHRQLEEAARAAAGLTHEQQTAAALRSLIRFVLLAIAIPCLPLLSLARLYCPLLDTCLMPKKGGFRGPGCGIARAA